MINVNIHRNSILFFVFLNSWMEQTQILIFTVELVKFSVCFFLHVNRCFFKFS